jgi:hypothetical protein
VSYDAIFIPGGGVREGGVLPAFVTARFDRALAVAGDALLVPLSAGTPYRAPPLDARGFPILEARAGAEYLVRCGADPRRIVIEESSHDTIGNAYFSRVIHAIPRGFRRVLVITSAFHMPRTEAAFGWVYGLEGPGCACAVEFEAVADEIEPEALAARVAKESASLKSLQTLATHFTTLAELHAWLFTEHGVYAVGARGPGAPVDTRTY